MCDSTVHYLLGTSAPRDLSQRQSPPRNASETATVCCYCPRVGSPVDIQASTTTRQEVPFGSLGRWLLNPWNRQIFIRRCGDEIPIITIQHKQYPTYALHHLYQLTIMGFGGFNSICKKAALPLCSLVGPSSSISGSTGIIPNCYARNIELANTIIFEGAASFMHIIALAMTVIMILHVRSKFTAVGKW